MIILVDKLKKHPFFVILIPVFFVLHGFLYYFGFIGLKEAALLAFIYCTGSAVLYFALWLLFRRKGAKAALVAAYLLMSFFFFGAVKDFLFRHFPLISRYSFLLSAMILTLLLVVWMVNKTSTPGRVVFLLNLLFSLYIIIDVVILAGYYVHPPANKFSVTTGNGAVYKPVAGTSRPDIYFLIFDEYASSLSLKEIYGYSNDIDSYLGEKGFRVLPGSFANYNYTPASIASILNMSFINGLRDSTVLTAKDMNYCFGLIKNNEVNKFLIGLGYEIVNCSHFNLLTSPVTVDDPILPVKTGLITDNTLSSKIKRDIFGDINWNPFQKLMPGRKVNLDQSNQHLLTMIREQSRKKKSHPVFVFGHLYMPHDPYLYDKNNRIRDLSSIHKDYLHPSLSYLEYLTHVNLEMKNLLDTIRYNTGNKAVVIVMGDHGFRGSYIKQNLHHNYQNLNAVYFPGKDYHLFYDSISGVNQFKIVFNTLFNQSIPLLKDSTIFLSDKE